jgi:predicted ribosomally synthesized peptide with SipW-like signal peptide
MKKIIGLSIAALLIISIVAVGTFAYFSDTAASTGNTWTAGTLVLSEVTLGASGNTTFTGTPISTGGINGNVQFGPVVPGSSGTITWTLSNTGNVPGKLTLVSATTFNDTATNAPKTAALAALAISDPLAWGTPWDLSKEMMVWVTRFDGTTTTDILGSTGTYVAMSGLQAALNLEVSKTITIGTPMVYVIHWQVPTTVGNEIQGDTAQLDITFTLNQNP